MTCYWSKKILGVVISVNEVNASRIFYSNRSSLIKLTSSGTIPSPNPVVVTQRRSIRTYFSSRKNMEEKTIAYNIEATNSTDEDRLAKKNLKDEYSDAFLEFSPEIIDRLAAEVAADSKSSTPASNPEEKFRRKKSLNKLDKDFEISEKTSPLMDLFNDMPLKKKPLSRLGVRRTTESDRFGKGLPDLRLSKLNAAKEEIWKPPPRKPWMVEKERIKAKYPDGYMPLKRLSPDAIDGIRALHANMPDRFTTASLAKEFKVSPEAIRRILKSKWRPKADEAIDREARWFRRGEKVWSRWADLGATPPAKYRKLGMGPKTRTSPYKPDPLPELITTSRQQKNEKNLSFKSDFDGVMI